MICPNCGKGTVARYATDDSLCGECSGNSSTTDKLSVEKLQEELESCIQTLIEASAAATIMQDIVVGNLVDRKLADLAKTHKLAVDYIEKVTGKSIDVVLAENAALEAEEE
ncbi:hypothetical protein EFL99_13055 [Lactococcus lactis]|nr:hypothetical protein [Lactococcus lactis]